jgi:RimJ/RimL family protein N-acetyltransferase
MNIETKRLVLRALEPEDAETMARIINDPKVRESLGAYNLVFPTSTELERRWIADSGKRAGESNMAITLRSDGRMLGLLALRDINGRNGSAHLAIMIERKAWDKGYGSEAIAGAVGHLFDALNMHRVWLRVDQGNARAIRCYEKCGFRKEGVLREDHFAHGGWRSSYLMSVLTSDLRRRSR